MRFRKPLLAAIVMLASLAAAPSALAQRAVSVIVINVERVVASSDAGRDMTTRLAQIQQQMQGELQPEGAAIAQEEQSIQQAAAGQTGEQLRANSSLAARAQALQQRAEQFRARQVTAARDFEYTRQLAFQEFNRLATPVVQEVIEAAGAGVALDASAVQLALPGADATDQVVQRLNQRVRSVNVTRQTAPAPQQQ